jgi:hypothetical protein
MYWQIFANIGVAPGTMTSPGNAPISQTSNDAATPKASDNAIILKNPGDAAGSGISDNATITQSDGAPTALNGSQLEEPDYDVEVHLSDLQADPNNPLYSAKTFEELDL